MEQWGTNELQEKKQSKLVIYLKLLVQPMPIMIWLAIFVEVGITIANDVTEGSPGTNWIDAIILLGIQFINATLGWYETIKAADAVAALKASLKPKATVKRDGKWQERATERGED